ncbi:ribonuclease H-like domain-containing protein [Anaerocolumna sp. MB42-C2]|uniref:ribonuclease H-like domain-containing protein n=1 Tax=Anaerocolumna sp. MB42-C2 TaxID=3070997 RepID=UPI0027DEFD19|nr:ribonuclease H-like domain-containing protein [Anaerocolumna sp. MB42-C2]WMJ87939.1 ribonuclease H-like domain-containing protein [Anaerocolumna sp. MB42-C2]
MKTYQTKLNINPSYPLANPYTWEDIIFFDIETTGFSSKNSYLYLIGCLYYKDNTWEMTQWLADDMISETLIIEAFFQMIQSYKRLIHFNGSGFDIPFILQKCKQHSITNIIESIESYDLYKKIIPYKKVLPLPNYKLKTIENYAGLKRLDNYTGEDLIQIYANYLGRLQIEKLQKKNDTAISANTKTNVDNSITHINKDNTKNLSSDELAKLILLHNFEDVKGLHKISDILYYTDIFEKDPVSLLTLQEKEITKTIESDFLQTDKSRRNQLSLQFKLPYTLLKSITLITPLSGLLSSPLPGLQLRGAEEIEDKDSSFYLKIKIENDILTMELPLYEGDLKYFYENYRDYYYLPKEDTAIHKSVAQYVDSEYKIKAKPSTCYMKKTSIFLPQTELCYTPFFKKNNMDKLTFFEMTNEEFQNDSKLFIYIKSLLHFITGNRETKVIV